VLDSTLIIATVTESRHAEPTCVSTDQVTACRGTAQAALCWALDSLSLINIKYPVYTMKLAR